MRSHLEFANTTCCFMGPCTLFCPRLGRGSLKSAGVLQCSQKKRGTSLSISRGQSGPGRKCRRSIQLPRNRGFPTQLSRLHLMHPLFRFSLSPRHHQNHHQNHHQSLSHVIQTLVQTMRSRLSVILPRKNGRKLNFSSKFMKRGESLQAPAQGHCQPRPHKRLVR